MKIYITVLFLLMSQSTFAQNILVKFRSTTDYKFTHNSNEFIQSLREGFVRKTARMAEKNRISVMKFDSISSFVIKNIPENYYDDGVPVLEYKLNKVLETHDSEIVFLCVVNDSDIEILVQLEIKRLKNDFRIYDCELVNYESLFDKEKILDDWKELEKGFEEFPEPPPPPRKVKNNP